MPAPKGNQFWKSRATHGRRLKFATPDELWAACEEYLEWVEDNPLLQEKAFAYQGVVTIVSIPKMRAMTLEGLCIFLVINRETWYLYRKREDFIGVTSLVERLIYHQKFAGAAAGLLNPNIIARELSMRGGQN